jgi:hypothetical protein
MESDALESVDCNEHNSGKCKSRAEHINFGLHAKVAAGSIRSRSFEWNQ